MMMFEDLINEREIRELLVKYNLNYNTFLTFLQDMLIDVLKTHLQDPGLKIKIYHLKNKKIPTIVKSDRSKIRLKDLDINIVSIIQKRINTYLSNIYLKQVAYKLSNMIGQLILVEIKGFSDREVVIAYNEDVYTISRDSFADGENLIVGSRVIMLLEDLELNEEKSYITLYLSRSSNAFVYEILKLAIPEVKNGSIVIADIYRIPMMTTVISIDKNATLHPKPIQPCVGKEGQRKKMICDYLGGEKIIFIENSESKLTIISRMLNISEVKIIIEEKEDSCKITIYNCIKYVSISNYQKLFSKIWNKQHYIFKVDNVNMSLLEDICNDDLVQTLRSNYATVRELLKVKPSFFRVNCLCDDAVITEIFNRLIISFYSENNHEHMREISTMLKRDYSIREYYSDKSLDSKI